MTARELVLVAAVALLAALLGVGAALAVLAWRDRRRPSRLPQSEHRAPVAAYRGRDIDPSLPPGVTEAERAYRAVVARGAAALRAETPGLSQAEAERLAAQALAETGAFDWTGGFPRGS